MDGFARVFGGMTHATVVSAAKAALEEFAASLSFEDRWRIAAIGAAAAQARGDTTQASALRAFAAKALEELRAAWKADAESYLKRPDLVRLRREAGLISTPQ
jgi:hypothetical protein